MSEERAAEATVEREGPTEAEPVSEERSAEATEEREGPTKAEPVSEERAAEATVEREGPTKAEPVSEATMEREAPTEAPSAKAPTKATSATVNGRRIQRGAGRGNHRGDQANRYFAHHWCSLHFLSTPAFGNQTEQF